MQNTIDNTRRNIGEMIDLSHKTKKTEKNILTKAEKMLEDLKVEIQQAAKSAMTNGADHYMEMILERGKLELVISKSRQALGYDTKK